MFICKEREYFIMRIDNKINHRNVIVASFLVCLFVGRAWGWRFAVMADSRGMPPTGVSSILPKIINAAIKDKPKFILFVGDLILGSSTAEPLQYQLISWKKAISASIRAGIPVYAVVGNHEVYGGRAYSSRQERICRDMLQLPDNGPIGYKGLVYSFDYANARFIILDSDLAGDEFRKIVGRQFIWLEKELISKGNKFVFVMFHEPAFPVGPHKGTSLDAYPAQRDRLWSVLSKYDVCAVFNGHEHLYNRSFHNGVWQIIAGTCGAPIYRGFGGAFYHYAIVDVGQDKVVMTVKDVNGRVRDRVVLAQRAGIAEKPIFSFGQIIGGNNAVEIKVRDTSKDNKSDNRKIGIKLNGENRGIIGKGISGLKVKMSFVLFNQQDGIKSKFVGNGNIKGYEVGQEDYSFSYKGVVFVIFDTKDITEVKIDWLKRELSRYKKAGHICVFMSRPLIRYGSKQALGEGKKAELTEKVLRIMKGYDVDFCAPMSSVQDYFFIGKYVNHIGPGSEAGIWVYSVYPEYISSRFIPFRDNGDMGEKIHFCPKLSRH